MALFFSCSVMIHPLEIFCGGGENRALDRAQPFWIGFKPFFPCPAVTRSALFIIIDL